MNRKLTSRSDPSPRESEGVEVELDWKAYFLEFCRVHGEPVQHHGRLIFRDGWSYSSSAFEGPEWGPPSDPLELDILVTRYWVLRRAELRRVFASLQHKLGVFKDLERRLSLPPQEVVVTEIEGGAKRRGYRPLDLSGLETRVQWVREDLEECDLRLRELEDFEKKQRTA